MHVFNLVYYYIDWGDDFDTGWIGPYDSEEETIKSHKWFEEGSYNIRVKAKDILDEESDWSDDFVFSTPKNKEINTPFLNFLENHQHMFPLLRQLLGL